MVWQRKDDPADTTPFIPLGLKRWEIVPELGPREGEVIIDKITTSASIWQREMRTSKLLLLKGLRLRSGLNAR
jgi:hypothetical protein